MALDVGTGFAHLAKRAPTSPRVIHKPARTARSSTAQQEKATPEPVSVHGEPMDLPLELHVRLADQGGVFTTAQAIAAGLVGRELGRLRSRRHLVRLRRGVWATRLTWDAATPTQRHVLHARAVALHLTPPYVLSHSTAAAVHDLPMHRVSTDLVHVTRPGRPSATRHEAGVCHHCGDVPEQTVVDGLPVTGLARTVVDVARLAGETAGVVAMDAALGRGVDAEEIHAALASCEGWPGTRSASRALAAADGRSQSVGETLARLAFRAVGLPPDELQWPVPTDAAVYETDFAWTGFGLVGEFDGKIKYGRLLEPGQTASDVLVAERLRELRIERQGWDVVRFTWAEVHDLPLVRARLLEAIDRRRARRPVA